MKTAFAGAKIEVMFVTPSDDGLSTKREVQTFQVEELTDEAFFNVQAEIAAALLAKESDAASKPKRRGPAPGFKKNKGAEAQQNGDAPAESVAGGVTP